MTTCRRRPAVSGIRIRWALAALVLLVPPCRAAEPARTRPVEPSPPRYGIEIREAWIPMPDGVRLAADLYVPTGGHARERFPVLLEYLPYRKNEGRGRNYPLYSYFVRRGYLVAGVDIRGTGNSEGRLIPYEYSDQENTDGDSVIAWLAAEPFSTGKVGMFGVSWGGFNSIHMAMRNPPALKAIIAVDATDDLYEDDVHFMDGMIHVDSWEMSQDLWNTLPGAPDFRIDDALFANRFDTPPWMLTYKRQQRYGPFWKRTTLKERYDAIRIPTFVIGGLYDGYRDSVPRMLEHLKAPVKAIVGPWSHAFPTTPTRSRRSSGATRRCGGSTSGSRGATRGSRASRASPSSCADGILPARCSWKRPASGATRRAGRSRASASARCARSPTTRSPTPSLRPPSTGCATSPRARSRRRAR